MVVGLVIVHVSVCVSGMRTHVYACATYCCLGSSCTFKSSGWGDGGGECWGGWDRLGSFSFLLREQLGFPAGDGWPGLRGGGGGMLRPLAPLSAETDAAAGVLSPCTIATSPQSPLLLLPTRSVASPQSKGVTGRDELLWKPASGGEHQEERGPKLNLPSLSLVSS